MEWGWRGGGWKQDIKLEINKATETLERLFLIVCEKHDKGIHNRQELMQELLWINYYFTINWSIVTRNNCSWQTHIYTRL